MRVDELNDETEAHMDEMTDRIRALEAQLATARASSDRWHGVAHRMEAERDAAVKRAEEAERRFREAMLKKADDISRLLGQLSEAQAREGRYREALERFVMEDGHVEACGNGGEDPENCSPLCHKTSIALSPSPVSGAAAPVSECETCATGYHDGCDFSGCPCTTCHPGAAAKEPCTSCHGTGMVLGLTRYAGLRDTRCPDCAPAPADGRDGR